MHGGKYSKDFTETAEHENSIASITDRRDYEGLGTECAGWSTDLIQSLEYHHLQHLSLNIDFNCSSAVYHRLYQVASSVAESLNAHVILVNSKDKWKAFFL